MTTTTMPRTTQSLSTETVIAGFGSLGAGSHGWLMLDQVETVDLFYMPPTSSDHEWSDEALTAGYEALAESETQDDLAAKRAMRARLARPKK